MVLVLKEMLKMGWKPGCIARFVLIGLTFWAIIMWLFAERFMRINSQPDHQSHRKNILIVVISFHVATLFFTFVESFTINRFVYVSMFTIGLALTATLLNTVLVSKSVITSQPSEQKQVRRDVASLVLQCFANALMVAYIFHLIRNNKKLIY